METISENIEILLNDFFKLQESGKEAFLKCFMMMLNEVELEIVLEAMDFRRNISLSYENSAIDSTVVSETGMEDLIGKVSYLGEDKRSIFIRFLIIKSKAKEIDLILHILDSRRELLNDDNLTKSSGIKDNLNDSKKKICESLTDSKLCSLIKMEGDSKPMKSEEVFPKENKNCENFYKQGEHHINSKGIEGLMDVNEEYKNEYTESTEVDTKIIKEDNNRDRIENLDVKMESDKSGEIYIPLNYEYLPCHLCSKNIKRIYMTRHTLSGNCVKSFTCDVCGKVLSSYGSLKNHTKIKHLKEYPLICDLCSKGFRAKEDLDQHQSKIHLKIPSTNDKLICDYCSKRFRRKLELERHVSRIHLENPSEEIFQCSLCPKTFNYKYIVVIHEKRVHGERSYFCDVCPKAFQTSNNLKKHRRKHTGEKPFSCSECGKCFSDSSNMKQHMKRHTPTTPQVF